MLVVHQNAASITYSLIRNGSVSMHTELHGGSDFYARIALNTVIWP